MQAYNKEKKMKRARRRCCRLNFPLVHAGASIPFATPAVGYIT
jgi:hypothetical protein